MLSIALFFIWMVAVGLLYGVLSALGVFDTLLHDHHREQRVVTCDVRASTRRATDLTGPRGGQRA